MGHVERSVQIDIDDGAPPFIVDIAPPPFRQVEPGAVDEHVQPAMRVDDARGDGVHGLRVDDIQGLDLGAAAGIGDSPRHRFQLRRAPARQDNRGSGVGQRQCPRPADTRARPGHPGNFSSDRLHIGLLYV